MKSVEIQGIAGNSADPLLNVVFIHGLGSSAETAWRGQRSQQRDWLDRALTWFRGATTDGMHDPGFFWPEWIVADKPQYAVYLIDYPADKLSWKAGWPLEEAAVAILDRLLKNPDLRKSSAPLVLICHSLGGLVAKQLILKANSGRSLNSEKAAFLDRVAGVVFIATPHDGAFLATLASTFGAIVSDAMRDLIANSAKLGELSDNYRDYIASEEGRILHLIYYEKAATGGITVVSPPSGNPGLPGAERIPIGRNHIDICKLEKHSDQIYEGVLAFFEKALESRPPSQSKKIDQVFKRQEEVFNRIEAIPQDVVDSLIAALDARGLPLRVQDQGVERKTIIALAQRLRPAETLDFDRAVLELENAVGVAVDVITRGTRGTNEGEFVNEVLARVASSTRKGNLEEGAREVDEALAQFDERRLENQRARAVLLEAAIAQDILRRDARSVALHIAALTTCEEANPRPSWTDSFHQRLERYRQEGEQHGNNFSLEIVAAMARRMRDDAQSPEERKIARNILGRALTKLGERERGNAHLEEAISVFREALQEATRECSPLDCAVIQNNLGWSLFRISEREAGTERLEEAIAAYREALKERTREKAPLDWAGTQCNLGAALLLLGGRRDEPEPVEEAVVALRATLQERTRELTPLDWAATQNNLGTALLWLGQRNDDVRDLEEAVAAFRAALEELTRERAPLDWAMAQYNLSAALRSLGEIGKDKLRLEESIAALHEALQEWKRERVPLDWAAAHHTLGNALSALGELETSSVHLQEAVAAYRQALQERTRELLPFDRAKTLQSLGHTLYMLGRREDVNARLEEAVAAYREALELCTHNQAPLEPAELNYSLGIVLDTMGKREKETTKEALFEQAVAAYEEASRGWTHRPREAFKAIGLQGLAMFNLALFRDDFDAMGEALDQIDAAHNSLRAEGETEVAGQLKIILDGVNKMLDEKLK